MKVGEFRDVYANVGIDVDDTADAHQSDRSIN